MPLFTWKPAYEINVPEIDMQHRHLVGIINELFDAMKNGEGQAVLNHILKSLLTYVEEHFATEEGFMRSHAYPGADIHIIEHDFLKRKVSLLQNRKDKGERIATPELMDFLKEWLLNHISESDKAFGKFLNEQQRVVER